MERYETNYDDFTLRDVNLDEQSGSLSPFTFLCITLILSMMGLLFAYSASYDYAIRMGQAHYYFLLEMVLYGMLALVSGIVLYFTPLEKLEKISLGVFPLSVVFLVLAAILKIVGYDSSAFVPFPFFRVSDFVIFSTVLFIASAFPRIRKRERRGWIYLFVASSAVLIIVSMAILGQYTYAILYFLILLILFNAGGIERKYTFTFALFLLTFVILVVLSSKDQTLMIFSRLMPSSDMGPESRIVFDCISAIAEGGIFGKGIGRGLYKLGIIPDIHLDYVFASFAEEVGFVGIMLIFCVFSLFMFLGLRAAARACRQGLDFIRIAALGYTYLIILKALLSILVTIGIFPSSGICFPFFSANGPEYFLTILECSLLYRFIHITGRGYERRRG